MTMRKSRWYLIPALVLFVAFIVTFFRVRSNIDDRIFNPTYEIYYKMILCWSFGILFLGFLGQVFKKNWIWMVSKLGLGSWLLSIFIAGLISLFKGSFLLSIIVWSPMLFMFSFFITLFVTIGIVKVR